MNHGVPLLEAAGISRGFSLGSSVNLKALLHGRRVRQRLIIQAVRNVDMVIHVGETVGLVGESGSGKSTLGRILAALDTADEGTVRYEGRCLKRVCRRDRTAALLRVQMVFQDPYGSLNPRMRVREIVGEAPFVHGLCARAEVNSHVAEALEWVGLDPSYSERFPHEFSGGQRQRIGIARALAVNPKVMICDEAVSALDVSVQAQIINLFLKLRYELGLAYLFISHDLGVVRHLSDRVAVMYFGSIVEWGTASEVFAEPAHPYTQSLLSELSPEGGRRKFQPIKGEIPSPLSPPPGCPFHPRCPHTTQECKTVRPEPKRIDAGRIVACHLFK